MISSLCGKLSFILHDFLSKSNTKVIKMKIIHTIKDLQTELTNCKQTQQKVGFVPTMGALHEGHASLMKKRVCFRLISTLSNFLS